MDTSTIMLIVALAIIFFGSMRKSSEEEASDSQKSKHQGQLRQLEAHYEELYETEAEELGTHVYDTETVYVCENCGWTGGRKEVKHSYTFGMGVLECCPSCGRHIGNSKFTKKTALTQDHPNYYANKRSQEFFDSYMKEQGLREQAQYANDEELPEFLRRIKAEEQKRKDLFRGTNPKPSKRQIPSHVKREVWRRDHGRCSECGGQEKLEYDHIIPVSRGGSNSVRNIQLLCEECNRKKSNNIE